MWEKASRMEADKACKANYTVVKATRLVTLPTQPRISSIVPVTVVRLAQRPFPFPHHSALQAVFRSIDCTLHASHSWVRCVAVRVIANPFATPVALSIRIPEQAKRTLSRWVSSADAQGSSIASRIMAGATRLQTFTTTNREILPCRDPR